MEIDQEGKCAICKKVPSGKGLQIDHSHETGKVRALLCVTCNMRLHALEDPDWTVKAKVYLEEYK